MLKNLLRRKQVNKNPEFPIPKRHSTFRTLADKKTAARRQHVTINAHKAKIYFIGAFSLTGLIVVIFGLYTLLTSTTFAINEFYFSGNSKATASDLNNLLSQWQGRNIFLLRTEEIRQKLQTSNFFFEKVTVKKIWPNKIKINISESRPELTLINLSGTYLITKNGLVLEVIAQDKLNFNEQELDIIKGFGSPNAKYVEERMRLDAGLPLEPTATPEAKKREETTGTSIDTTFDFAAIEQEKKIEVLNLIRSELISKVQETWDKYNEIISQKEFAALPRIFAYDNNTYTERDRLSLSRLEVANEVLSFFNNKRDMIIERIVWESDFTISIQLTTSQNIIFGVNRKASEQLEDLELVLNNIKLQGKDYSKIDLSSKRIAVTFK